MIYIQCALLAEASFLIAHHTLSKSDDKQFPIYENETIKLIISGIGKVHAASATTYLLQKYSAKKGDKIYNIGTCTSSNDKQKVGELFNIKKIIDYATDKVYHLNHEGETLTCVDKAVDSHHSIHTSLADMESSGFYLAAKRFIKREHIMIVKVISDKTDSTLPHAKDIKALFHPHIQTIGALLL